MGTGLMITGTEETSSNPFSIIIAGVILSAIVLYFTAKIAFKKSPYSMKGQNPTYIVGLIIAAFMCGPLMVSSSIDKNTSSGVKILVIIVNIVISGGVCYFFWKSEAEEVTRRIIRKESRELLPTWIEDYIQNQGYTTSIDFLKHCESAPKYEKARSVRYLHPDYDRVQEYNKNLSKEKQIKLDEWVDFSIIAANMYESYVKELMQKQFLNVAVFQYAFDREGIYEMLPGFHQFMSSRIKLLCQKNSAGLIYQIEDESNNKFYISSLIGKAIPELLTKGYRSVRLEDGGSLYISSMTYEEFTAKTGVEPNMEEGETLVI